MILCDSEIKAAIQHGHIKIDPEPPAEMFTTTAVDLRLGGSEFKRWRQPPPGMSFTIDPSQPDFFPGLAEFLEDAPRAEDGSLVLSPGRFIVARTLERLEIAESGHIAARVEGKSSLARIGLGVHITAPTIHSGFRGFIALEIKNHGDLPIVLRPGMPICQLIFEMVFGTPKATMTGIFQDQETVAGRAQN